VDDQVILAESETLYKNLYINWKTPPNYGLTIQTDKTKTMEFRGGDPIRSKITIKTFINYGNHHQVLKPSNVHKQTRLWVYNTTAISTLLYGSETWTLKEKDKARITAAEMKCLRKIHTIWPQKESRQKRTKKYNQFCKNSITIKMNGYMFAEWTYLDSQTLRWNTNQQERWKQDAH
jgi:hypothetical protein